MAVYGFLLFANSKLIRFFSTRHCLFNSSISLSGINFNPYPRAGVISFIFVYTAFNSSLLHFDTKGIPFILRDNLTLELIITSDSFPFCIYQLTIIYSSPLVHL